MLDSLCRYCPIVKKNYSESASAIGFVYLVFSRINYILFCYSVRWVNSKANCIFWKNQATVELSCGLWPCPRAWRRAALRWSILWMSTQSDFFRSVSPSSWDLNQETVSPRNETFITTLLIRSSKIRRNKARNSQDHWRNTKRSFQWLATNLDSSIKNT